MVQCAFLEFIYRLRVGRLPDSGERAHSWPILLQPTPCHNVCGNICRFAANDLKIPLPCHSVRRRAARSCTPQSSLRFAPQITRLPPARSSRRDDPVDWRAPPWLLPLRPPTPMASGLLTCPDHTSISRVDFADDSGALPPQTHRRPALPENSFEVKIALDSMVISRR